MESDKIYEESLEELKHIRRQFSYGSITIEVDKLDARSKEKIIYALSSAVGDRITDVTNLISGVA